MILSIIVPVYNEEKTVIDVLNKIKSNSSNLFKYEIIVIDDGSTDQSRKLLEDNKHLYDKLLVNEFQKLFDCYVGSFLFYSSDISNNSLTSGAFPGPYST